MIRDDHHQLDADDSDEESLAGDAADPLEYDKMLRLERFESLEEEMEELGITTLEQLRAKIAELHRTLDEQQGD
ncbi:MAG: hypothetical protein ACHQ4H_10840 [Ktedonobacterales bacterium]